MNKTMMAAALTAGMMALTAGAVTDAELLNGLRRQYDKDMATEAGRIKWNGEQKRLVVTTNGNFCVSVREYENGYRHVFTNKLHRLVSAFDNLTKEERKKKMQERMRLMKEKREREEKERLWKLLEKHPELRAN